MVGILLGDIHAAIRRTTIDEDILRVLRSLVDDSFNSATQSFLVNIINGDDGVSHMIIFYTKITFFSERSLSLIKNFL